MANAATTTTAAAAAAGGICVLPRGVFCCRLFRTLFAFGCSSSTCPYRSETVCFCDTFQLKSKLLLTAFSLRQSILQLPPHCRIIYFCPVLSGVFLELESNFNIVHGV